MKSWLGRGLLRSIENTLRLSLLTLLLSGIHDLLLNRLFAICEWHLVSSELNDLLLDLQLPLGLGGKDLIF